MTAAPQSTPSPATPRPPVDDRYAHDIQTAWREFLGTLPPSARLLDIGIGNHVAALVASEMAASRGIDWQIDVIDPDGAAQAGSDAQAGKPTFHAGAAWAHLPFEDATFDAVCGHHAIEFTDSTVALAEVHRVLKPGGDAQFLMHHADSALLQAARLSLREADLVFGHTKAFRRVHRLVTMRQVVPGTTERATEEVRTAIRALKRGLEIARANGGGRVLGVALDAIQQLLASRREGRPDASGLAVDRAEADLRASIRRLGDLVNHARADADMQLVENAAAQAGFTQVERSTLSDPDGKPMAWQLMLHRP